MCVCACVYVGLLTLRRPPLYSLSYYLCRSRSCPSCFHLDTRCTSCPSLPSCRSTDPTSARSRPAPSPWRRSCTLPRRGGGGGRGEKEKKKGRERLMRKNVSIKGGDRKRDMNSPVQSAFEATLASLILASDTSMSWSQGWGIVQPALGATEGGGGGR